MAQTVGTAVSRPRRALGRVRGAARRAADEARPPRRSVLRWLRVGPRGDVGFGKAAHALDAQAPGRVVLGEGVQVGDHVEVVLGPQGRLEIGAGTVIGAHTLFVADRLVQVGRRCRLGTYSVLVDTWTYGRGEGGSGGVPVLPPAPVTVGDDARLGMRTILGPGVTVAAGEVVATGVVRHVDLEDAP